MLTTVKSVLSGHSKIDKTKILLTNGSLMEVKRIAECSPWSILQYFLPVLRDNWPRKPMLVIFESGGFRQGLLYYQKTCFLHFDFSENLASFSTSSNSYRTGTVGKFILKSIWV